MNKKLQKNLKEIREINPVLWGWIENSPEEDWVKEIKSEDGAANLLITEGNRTIAAYRMKGSKREAHKAANNMKLYKENVSIIIGFGLGYVAKAILDKMEKGHKLIVIEPVGHIIRLALSNIDFSDAIKKHDMLLLKPEVEDIAGAIGLLDSTLVVNDWLLTINKYTRLKIDQYQETMKAVMDVLNQVMCSVGTIAGTAGAKIADNDIACLPYVIRHRGVSELSQLFKDKPAILVSTGPSLAKNIHQLIDVSKQNKAIIIAVGQALRILLAYDIKPDFICTVDFGEVNMGHFKGLMDSKVPLVTINRAYAPLLKAWQGPKFVVATPVPGHEKTAAGILTEKGFLEAGGSVAHLCFSFAQALGCNPIALTGQDLALGETSHIPLADAAGKINITKEGMIKWDVKDQRCQLHNDEGKEYNMGPIHQVPGYYGKPVATNLGLASFITSFEGMARRSKAEVINATEGGADIKHMKKMMLKEFIDKYCQEEIDKNKLEELKTLADDGDELVSKVIPKLSEDIDNLDEIIKQGRRGLAACHGLKKLLKKDNYKNLLPKDKKRMLRDMIAGEFETKNPDKISLNMEFFDKVIGRLKKSKLKNIAILSRKNFIASEKTRIASTKNPLVNVAIYGASRRIFNRDLKVKESFEHFLTHRADALTRLERNKIILTAAVEAAESLKPSYEETLKVLKEYDKTKDNDLLMEKEPEEIDLSDAEEYFAQGNWAHPLVDVKMNPYGKGSKVYEKAIAMRDEAIQKAKEDEEENWERRKKIIKYNELLKESREMGREDQDFEGALEKLREAADLLPDEVEAKWGIATALHHGEKISESLEAYEELVDQFPDNKQFRFEMGQVMLKAGKTMEGLEAFKEAMTDTNQFDGSLVQIAQLYEHAGMKKEALNAYNLYLKAFPADYEGWNLKGCCLNRMGRNGLAIKAFKQCLRIKPDFEQARKNIKAIKGSR